MKKIVSIIMLLHAVAAFSQNEANIWYFGYKGGVDFNSGAPVALTNGALFTDEGCAVLSNSEGQLQFYTDGVTVYNKNHQVMQNGNNLLGSYTSSQSATIVQKPGSLNLFYIFTTGMQGIGSFAYSEVDINANNGLGKVTENKNIVILPLVTEQCTVIPHSNGTDIWVIAHGYNNNTFYSYLLTPDGLSTTPVTTSIGFVMANLDSPPGAIGLVKASPDGDKVVLTANESGVQLFDFNAATGVFSNVQTLTEGIFFYGAEFSSSGNVLYISHSMPNVIVQYDLTAEDIPEAWQIVAEDIEQHVGALQMGPDGKIYFVLNNLNSLSVINNPEVIGTGCNITYQTVPLGIGNAFYGLPNFAPSIFKQHINSDEYCLGEATQFSTGPGAPDSVAWNFGDGTTSQEVTPQHTFTAAGTYTVTATINFLGIPKTLTHKVVITPAPQFTLGEPYTTCTASQVMLAAQDPDFDPTQATYLWELNGQEVGNTATLQPQQFGTYNLTITVNGCSTTHSVEVIQKTVAATFTEGCVNNSYTLSTAPAEDSFDAATATYTWTGPNGFTANGAQAAIPATGEYTVGIITADGCTITHTWNVANISGPQFTLGGPYTTCTAAQTELAAQNQNFDPTQATYLWELNGQTVGNTATLQPEQFGTYSLTVTVNGCSTTQSVEIIQKTVTATYTEGCINNSYTLGAAPADDSFNTATATYTWTGPNGFTASGAQAAIATPGTYVLTLTTDGGCVLTHTWNVTDTNKPQFTLNGSYTACTANQLKIVPEPQNFASAQAAYLWELDGVAVATTATLQPEEFGTYTLTVTVNGCKTTETIEVTQLSIAATFTEGCVNNSYTLGATPEEDSFDAATATYTWTGPDGFSASGAQAIVSITGEYVLNITTPDGCTIIHTWDITDTGCPGQMIPRGVSPNDDGKNDTFDLSLHDVAKLDIFNRYGLLVFSQHNYTTQWHGQANDGDILPTGTYFYCIHKRSGKDITGWVYVNR